LHVGADFTEWYGTDRVSDFSKSTIRASALAARRALAEAVRAEAARLVQAALAELVASVRPSILAGYAPFGTEPGGPDLPERLAGMLPAGGTLLLPAGPSGTAVGWVVHPSGSEASLAGVELVVVPALAVDRRGTRLGRGAGWYDRALAEVPRTVPVVALLHDGELQDEELPAEPHDRPVTGVITPSLGHLALPA
jgi:5-formyltetrahydrofolate cyclo-ligase